MAAGDATEIIVSINSEPGTRSKVCNSVKEKFGNRVKIIFPEKALNLCEHWRFMISKAEGEWITILTDRALIRRDWRVELEAAAKTSRLISYPSIGVIKTRSGYTLQPPRFTGKTILGDPLAALNAAKKMRFSSRAPYFLNSMAHRSVIKQIEARLGCVAGDTAGDCGFFSELIAIDAKWTVLDKPLFVMHSREQAVGNSAVRGVRTPALESCLEFIRAKGGLIYSPIPEIVTGMNARVNEFRFAMLRAGRGSDAEVDPKAYCESINAELSVQKETFPENAADLLAAYAKANGVSLSRPWKRSLFQSTKTTIRGCIENIGPIWHKYIGRVPFNLPVAKVDSLDQALSLAVNLVLKPNSSQFVDREWR